MSDTESILGTHLLMCERSNIQHSSNSFTDIEKVKLDIVKAFDDSNFIDDPNYTEDEYNSDTTTSSDTVFDSDYFPCFYEYCDQDAIKSCIECNAHMCKDHFHNGKESGKEMCTQCAISYLFIKNKKRKKDINNIFYDIDKFMNWNKSISNKIYKTKKDLLNLEDQTNLICGFILIIVLLYLIYNLIMTFV